MAGVPALQDEEKEAIMRNRKEIFLPSRHRLRPLSQRGGGVKRKAKQLIGPSALVLGILTLTWLLVAAFSARAESSQGIAYGPLWFGQNPADYGTPGALEAFSGTALATFHTSDPEGILRAAQDHGLKVLVALGDEEPCHFWNSTTFTFDYEAFMQIARREIPVVARFYPETVIGAIMLNEPFWMNWPTATCNSAVPPKILYNLVKRVRAEFAANGLTDPNFLLGVNAYPRYMDNPLNQPGYKEPPGGGGRMTEAEKRDGTINLLTPQYNGPAIVDFDAYFSEDKRLMREWGVEAAYIAIVAGDSLPVINTWMCQQDDAAMVSYWMWGNQTVALSSLIPVRQTCDGNIVVTPTPTPSMTPSPTPTFAPSPTFEATATSEPTATPEPPEPAATPTIWRLFIPVLPR